MSFLTRILPLVLVTGVLIAGCGSDGSSETTAPAQSGGETTPAQESTQPSGAPAGATARVCPGGGDNVRQLHVTGMDCGRGATVARGWAAGSGCKPSGEQSRSACTVGRFRCFATVVDEGLAVSCGRPEQALGFIAKPD
jgi:hypothetical protein